MNKTVRGATLVLAHVCASTKATALVGVAAAALVALAWPAAAQQTAATPGMSDEQLRKECRRLFAGKTFVGVIKNSDHPRYSSGRREISLSTTVESNLRTTNGTIVCPVQVRSEDDGRKVNRSEYLFDGSIAKRTDSKDSWVSLTPQGSCMRLEGWLWLYGTRYSMGNSLLCSR